MIIESKDNAFWGSLLIVLFLTIAFVIGCVATLQPEPHPIAGKSVMFIPEGCKIGDIKAPEDGIYIGESKLIESMKREREAEKRRKQKHT